MDFKGLHSQTPTILDLIADKGSRFQINAPNVTRRKLQWIRTGFEADTVNLSLTRVRGRGGFNPTV